MPSQTSKTLRSRDKYVTPTSCDLIRSVPGGTKLIFSLFVYDQLGFLRGVLLALTILAFEPKRVSSSSSRSSARIRRVHGYAIFLLHDYYSYRYYKISNGVDMDDIPQLI